MERLGVVMYEKREHVRFLYHNVIKINNNVLRNCRGISNLFYTLILEEKTLWWFNNNIINLVVKMLVGWKFNRDGNLTGNPGISRPCADRAGLRPG